MSDAHSRSTLPYVVIDQNVLRDSERIRELLAAARTTGQLILLPDIALYEMTQHPASWVGTVRASFAALARLPAVVVMAHAPGSLLRQERASGEPSLDLVDHDVTLRLRQLLLEVESEGTDILDEIAARLPAAREEFQQQQVDHEANLRRIRRMMDAWKALLGPELQRLVRHQVDVDRDNFRLLLAHPRFHETVIHDALRREGFSELVASGPSVAARQFLCFAGLALRWLARGWESRAAANASRDLADLDYVLLALFCSGGLASKDRDMVELYSDLAAALARVEDARSAARGAVDVRRDLRARARSLAQLLGSKYGARRVVLFGSLVHHEERLPGDVDLFVDGLRAERWVEACTEADAVMEGVHVDLIRAESAHPSVRDQVAASGETLFEAPPG